MNESKIPAVARFMVHILPIEPIGNESLGTTRIITGLNNGSEDAAIRILTRELESGLDWLKTQLTEDNVRRLLYGNTEEKELVDNE